MLTLREKECYTTMTNFILKYKGAEKPDLNKMTAILDAHKGHLIDGSLLPASALIEIDDAAFEPVRKELDGDWSIVPEFSYHVPDLKKKIKKS